MILEIDAGNSRIKWRLLEVREGHREKVADGAVAALLKAPSVFIELGQQMARLPLDKVTRTKVANVRGKSFREAFSALMNEKWHLQPEYAVVERSRAGVTNAYEDVTALGVDRWLAMLAGFQRARGGCCIVDCGSAVTVDLLGADGRHAGGYIVPGLRMMLEALGSRSRALRFEGPAEWQATRLGVNSREAVENGILSMLLGLLEQVRAGQGDGVFEWFLTGGDADIVSRHLTWEHQQVPELVMDGLGIAIDGEAGDDRSP